MIEALLTVIILALIGAFSFYVHESNKEKAKLVNALIAKDAQELTNLTLADQTTIKPQVKQPDLVPFEDMGEAEFDKHIEDQLAEEQDG